MELISRPRRLRGNSTLRKMVRETRMDKSTLVYPMFVMEGANKKEEIPSMAGQYRYSVDRMEEKLLELLKAGVQSVMLFGLPAEKDEMGSGAYAEDGIVQKAFRKAKEVCPELYLIGDVCMCEYTSHGHCGILCGQEVDNDRTLGYLAKIALSQVQAGADMVAPSDMMDGRVAAIRSILDQNGHADIPIMSYAVKFASSFYGPFRDAAGSAPAFGDRKSYQMDYHNRRGSHKRSADGRGGRRGYFDGEASHGLWGFNPRSKGQDGHSPCRLFRQRGIFHGESGCSRRVCGWGQYYVRNGSQCVPGGGGHLHYIFCRRTGKVHGGRKDWLSFRQMGPSIGARPRIQKTGRKGRSRK